MLTVLIQTTESTRDDWLEEAIRSVDHGGIKIIDAHYQKIGWDRARALNQVSTPYVALLDCDDRVTPGSLKATTEALVNQPDAGFAFTREETFSGPEFPIAPRAIKVTPGNPNSRRWQARNAHHLVVYRMVAVRPHTDAIVAKSMPERWLNALILRDAPAVFVDRIGYQWRQHAGQLSRRWMPIARQAENDELEKLYQELPA